jgi:hypothetical protein
MNNFTWADELANGLERSGWQATRPTEFYKDPFKIEILGNRLVVTKRNSDAESSTQINQPAQVLLTWVANFVQLCA